MLSELRIRNFAVIEEASLSFGPGLNILSGETGAGKTIVMTALGLLLGGRASSDLVRAGAKEALVEGIFELEGEGPPAPLADWLNPDNPRELIVRRVLAEGGRARLTVNDNAATVQALIRAGTALVEIYGQHEQQALLQRENHLAILDRHAGLERDVAAYAARYDEVRALEAQLAELSRRERDRADLLEIARFRLAELERAALVVGEDESLAAQRLILANAAKLAEAADSVEQSLSSGESPAIDLVARAESRLREAAALDSRLAEPLELLETARANLEETAHRLRTYASQIEADPERLEQLEARLNELTRLKRKYGGTLDAALAALGELRREVAELEAVDARRAEVATAIARALADLATRAAELSRQRLTAASDLARRMNAELKTLGMRSAVFEARLTALETGAGALTHEGAALGPSGRDVAEFIFAATAGQPALPLARVASGGELSRVMLALKRLEAQRRSVATLIFDEVDAGIGGAVAEIVGRKLKQLSRYHQILCVTHLAQIAAFADRHFVVEKAERRGLTRSSVVTLAAADRPLELARMLGGDESNPKFLAAARELLARASD